MLTGELTPPRPPEEREREVEGKLTHSTPRRFRSAASSRWRCSITCFARVASPNSLRNNPFVTLSHNLLLSVGCCFDIGRTILGTERNGDRSISVIHSSSSSLFLSALLLFAGDVDDDDEDEEDERAPEPEDPAAAARVEVEA